MWLCLFYQSQERQKRPAGEKWAIFSTESNCGREGLCEERDRVEWRMTRRDRETEGEMGWMGGGMGGHDRSDAEDRGDV